LHYIKYIYANRITRSKSALINRNRTDNPTAFVQVEETDEVKQELHYHLYRNDIAEIKSHLADMQLDMAYLKMDVAIITREMAEMSALFKKKLAMFVRFPKVH
jgi:hypothetical protein